MDQGAIGGLEEGEVEEVECQMVTRVVDLEAATPMAEVDLIGITGTEIEVTYLNISAW